MTTVLMKTSAGDIKIGLFKFFTIASYIMILQETRLDKLQRKISNFFADALVGPWKRRSLGLISLLLGFYIGSNLTVYYLQKIGQRPIVVLFMVIIIEVLVRFRTTVKNANWPLHWLVLDNLRIGAVYAVVLEAFKLGS